MKAFTHSVSIAVGWTIWFLDTPKREDTLIRMEIDHTMNK